MWRIAKAQRGVLLVRGQDGGKKRTWSEVKSRGKAKVNVLEIEDINSVLLDPAEESGFRDATEPAELKL